MSNKKSLEEELLEARLEFERTKKRTQSDVTIENNGIFTGKKGDGFKVDFSSDGKKQWVIYDCLKLAYEKATMLCNWK